MSSQYDSIDNMLRWWFATFALLISSVAALGLYLHAHKETAKSTIAAKVPPITYEHTSDYIGHVGDCEMYKVVINETNGRNEIKVSNFIMAKCPNASTSILE